MDIQSLFFERLERTISEKYEKYSEEHDNRRKLKEQKIKDWSNLYKKYNLKGNIFEDDSHLSDKQRNKITSEIFALTEKYHGINDNIETQLSEEEFYKNCIDRIIEHCDNSHVSRNEIYFT